jgi:hypothetical protein
MGPCSHRPAAGDGVETLSDRRAATDVSPLIGEAQQMLKQRAWLAALLVTLALPLDASESLTMRVSPRMSFAPTNLSVRVHIQPDASNRMLEIVADSSEFYRSSQLQLEGDQAPRTIVVEFRGVPCGAYEVYGVLTTSSGRRVVVRQQANVIASTADR